MVSGYGKVGEFLDRIEAERVGDDARVDEARRGETRAGVARIDAAALVRAPDRVYERSLGQVTAPHRRSIL
jgi:hypothetical protein